MATGTHEVREQAVEVSEPETLVEEIIENGHPPAAAESRSYDRKRIVRELRDRIAELLQRLEDVQAIESELRDTRRAYELLSGEVVMERRRGRTPGIRNRPKDTTVAVAGRNASRSLPDRETGSVRSRVLQAIANGADNSADIGRHLRGMSAPDVSRATGGLLHTKMIRSVDNRLINGRQHSIYALTHSGQLRLASLSGEARLGETNQPAATSKRYVPVKKAKAKGHADSFANDDLLKALATFPKGARARQVANKMQLTPTRGTLDRVAQRLHYLGKHKSAHGVSGLYQLTAKGKHEVAKMLQK